MLEDFPEYIMSHRINQEGETIYYVKWMGCDITDNTWETEEKLRIEWPKALADYKKLLKTGKTPREAPSDADNQRVFEYTNSVKDWEKEVAEIVYIEKSKIPGYIVYIRWQNGFKSIHHSSEVYAKCPQKMIEYFEKFATFNEIFIE